MTIWLDTELLGKGRLRSVAKAIRRGKRTAGYLLCIVGGISVATSVVLTVMWNAVGPIMFVAGLFLLFGWSSLLFGWVMSRKPPDR
jgi:hypothetical protein